MRLRTISPLLLVVYCLGCAQEIPPPPDLREVCRTDYEQTCLRHGWAGERLMVRIIGTDLHPAYEVDLGDTKQPTTKGEFRAWIGTTELEQVSLSEYSDKQQQILTAMLPGNLPVGEYDLEVETPLGYRDILQSAFSIADPLRLEARIDKTTLPLGDSAQLMVTLENQGPSPLTHVSVHLEQVGTGPFLLPPATAPSTMPAIGQTIVTLDLLAQSLGEGQLSVSASAQAGAGVALGPTDPATLSVTVVEQASLDIVATLNPSALRLGEAISLTVTVNNTGDLVVHRAHVLAPEMSGVGSIQWDAPNTDGVSIQPGGNQQFQILGYASGSGTLDVLPTIEAEEGISGRPLLLQAQNPIQVTVQP